MNRTETETVKVSAPGFNPIYLHFTYSDDGHPVGMWISSPGKYADQQLGELLNAISAAATAVLER
jgi:hypothetical protein